jgi:peptidoglycan/LPS O-acetylase OafA/YrhL
MNYLTSMRGIAAFIVVLYHLKGFLHQHAFTQSFDWMYNKGYLAVDFFFVLSGFIIAFNYKHHFEKEIKWHLLYVFIVKRIARIYPLHIFILLCFILIPMAHVLTNRPIDSQQYSLLAFLYKFFLVDLWMIGQQYWNAWNAPSWTISGEMFAYLTFPFVCFFIGRDSVRHYLFFVLAVVLIALCYEALSSRSLGDNISHLGLLRCVLSFVCGVCIYEFHLGKLIKSDKINRMLFYLAAIILIFLLLYVEKNHFYVPLLFSLILLTSLGFRDGFHKFLELRWLVVLGEISYSLYLSHIFILTLCIMFILDDASHASLLQIAAYLSITIIFSSFTYTYIEVPMRRLVTKRCLKGNSTKHEAK